MSHSPEKPEATPPSSRAKKAAVMGVLAVGTLLLFGQAVSFPFINLDDPAYIFEQPVIAAGLSWDGVFWAFTHVHSGNWHPLTSISHMLDCEFFGLDPAGPHLMNVFLHSVAATLLFLCLFRMTGSIWRSALVSALFAWHPLRVESVAWISERKDVLSGCLFFLTLLAWLRYLRTRNWISYSLVLVLFAFGLMAKPMLVTLPFLLLLLDHWPLNRSAQVSRSQLLLEKLPLLFLSLASSIATLLAQREAISSIEAIPFLFRLGNALDSYLLYINKTLWPVDLGLIYPYPQKLLIPLTIAACIVVGVFSVAAFLYRKRFPYLCVGWFWFLIGLLPVIGLLQVGIQGYADRYTYLPQIGLLIALVWGLDAAKSAWDCRPRIVWAAAGLLLFALAWTSHTQLRLWHNPVKLWVHTIDVTEDNYAAHSNLAASLMHRGMVAESLAASEEAVRLNPIVAEAQNNLALALFRSGRLREAARHWEIAYRLRPYDKNVECNFGWLLATSPDSSLRNGMRAVELTGDVLKRGGARNPGVLRRAAAAMAEVGRFSDSIALAERAISLAQATGNTTLMNELNRNLANYRAELPVRDSGVVGSP